MRYHCIFSEKFNKLIKMKKMAIPNTNDNVKQLEFFSIADGCARSIATLQKCLVVLYNGKHTLTI